MHNYLIACRYRLPNHEILIHCSKGNILNRYLKINELEFNLK